MAFSCRCRVFDVLFAVYWIGIAHAPIAYAATYYVAVGGSGSTCSLAAPCGTVASGVGKLSAGDTLYLRSGTYNERIHPADYHVPTGTSWANVITIAGYPGETATLFGGVALQDNLDASIVSYMIFDNLTLRSSDSGSNVFRVGGNSHHIKLTNSDLTHGGSTLQQIVFITDGTDSVEISHNYVHDAPLALPDANGITYGTYGMYIYGRHMLIDGNIVANNAGYGIHHYHQGDPNVSNNIIRNNVIHGNAYGLGNRGITNCGVIMTSGSNNYFYDNLVYDNNTCGVQIGGNSGNFVYNNTITVNPGSGIQLDVLTDNLTFRNNIIYNNGDGTAGSQIVDYGSTNTVQTNNYLNNPLFQ